MSTLLRCGCMRGCSGSAQEIPRRTWFTHAKHRRNDRIIRDYHNGLISRAECEELTARPSPTRDEAEAELAAFVEAQQADLEALEDEDEPEPNSPGRGSQAGDETFPGTNDDEDDMQQQLGNQSDAESDHPRRVRSRSPDSDAVDGRRPPPDVREVEEEEEVRAGGGRPLRHERDAIADDEDPPDVREVDGDEDDAPTLTALLDSRDWVDSLRDATLDNDFNSEDARHRLRHAPTGPFSLNGMKRYCMREYLNIDTVERYNYSLESLLEYDPDVEPYSIFRIKAEIEKETGIEPVWCDMCSESCVAFVGLYKDERHCPNCGRSRYRDHVEPSGRIRRVAVKQCLHIPVGPQVSSYYSTPEAANNMDYRRNLTAELLGKLERGEQYAYEDYCTSTAYMQAVQDGDIRDDDIVLVCSLDGAQLYRNKQSDCWFLIWINMNLPPTLRYQKKYIMIGAIIPGPNKPKHLDSFLYPSLYHLVGLQKEGMTVWNARTEEIESKGVYFWLGLADGPGLALMSGLVPHHGGKGCRIYCGLPGRSKGNRAPHYYPALRKPAPPYSVPNSCHDTINIDDIPQPSVQRYEENLRKLLSSRTDTEYKRLRLETGIVKPSLFSALPRALPVPFCFGVDATMHVLGINIPDLFINLFLGKFKCEKPDSPDLWPWACFYNEPELWKRHGALVAAARCFFPGSFDRAPRNIAEKLNSGYKAWELILYFYGLAPALLFGILEEKYWAHLCKLVAAARILMQYKITCEQLETAHDLLREFVAGYENDYYSARSDRIHFVRQSIHILLHLVAEVIRVGPGAYTSQWPLERTIGNLGEEINQHSTYFENLCERSLWRAHKNAVKVKFGFDTDKTFKSATPGAPAPQATAGNTRKASLPDGAVDCGHDYVLLRARDEKPFLFTGHAAEAVTNFMDQIGGTSVPDGAEYQPAYRRYARLSLPNGQIARAEWREGTRVQDRIRRSRMVKTMNDDGDTNIVEVRAYFRAKIGGNGEDDGEFVPFALVSKFGEPDEDLLKRSHGVLHVATYQGEDDLGVIPVDDIKSVVAMIPFQHHHEGSSKDRYFLVEKPGLEMLWWSIPDDERQEGFEGDG